MHPVQYYQYIMETTAIDIKHLQRQEPAFQPYVNYLENEKNSHKHLKLQEGYWLRYRNTSWKTECYFTSIIRQALKNEPIV
jgi:hypothetical protein